MNKIKAVKPTMTGNARQHVSKHFDIVLAIDFHWTTFPFVPSFGFIPLPMPHPFVGMVFDPMDYLHFDIPIPSFLQEKVGAKSIPMGGSIYVHGRHKATTTTSVMGVLLPFRHISSIPGLYFIVNIPGSPHEGEVYWGSTTVLAQGSELSGSDPQHVLTCWCPPMGLKMLPTMPNKIKKNPLAYFAFYNEILSMYVQINTSGPVLVGGAFAPHKYTPGEMLMRFAGMALMKGLGKLGGALSKKALKGVNKILQRGLGETNSLSRKLCDWGFEPVNFVTGAMFFEWTDFELPAGTPLKWDNAWRSDKPLGGMLGNSVYNSYDLYIIPDAEAGIAGFSHPDENMVMPLPYIEAGSMPYYDRSQKVWMERPDNQTWILVLDQNTYTYERRQEEGIGEIFRIRSINYANGTQLSFEYHRGKGLLAAIKDNCGRMLELTPDAKGTHIAAVHYHHRTTHALMVRYEYDDNGNLVKVFDPAGKSIDFHYDNNNRVVKRTNRNGASYFWEYDAAGRVIHTSGVNGFQEGRLNYFPEQGYNDILYADGRVETIHYDENDLIYKKTDAMGGETWYEYTRYNERKLIASPEGKLVSYEYDEQGNIAVFHTPEGEQYLYEYNERNQLIKRTEPSGLSESLSYDEQYRLVQHLQKDDRDVRYFYDEKEALPFCCIDDQETEIHWQYNTLKQLVVETGPDGNATWQYDDYGRVVRHSPEHHRSTLWKRDQMGRVTCFKESGNDEITFAYDAYDLPVYAADGKEEWRMDYTPMGNLRQQVRRSLLNPADTRVLQYSYDNYDQLQAITNEKGEHYTFSRDANDEVTEETGFDGLLRRYIRNRDGDILKTILPDGKHIHHTYDLAGRLVYNKYDDDYWEAYRYDRSGLLAGAENPANSLELIRNPLGQVIRETQGNHSIDYTYDAMGNLAKLTSSLGADIRKEYNALGQLAGMKTQNGDREWFVGIGRNTQGEEANRSMSGGIMSTFEYDHEGRPVSQRITQHNATAAHKLYQWQPDNKLGACLDLVTGGKSNYSYDAYGSLIAATYEDKDLLWKKNGDTGDLYKTSTRADRIYSKGGKLLKDDQWYYSYDTAGNLILKSKRNINGLAPLTAGPHENQPKQWAWQTTDITTPNADDHLQQLPDGTPGVPEWERGDWAYTWYPNGMLKAVKDAEGREVAYEYDALGRRTAKITGGRIRRYLWDGDVLLHEWEYDLKDRPKLVVDAAGKLSYDREESVDNLTTWIYDQDSFTPCAKLADGKYYSIVSNYMGTPMMAFDDNGKKVWSCELDIYGKIRNLTGDKAFIPFRYQGQYEDEETGLYYNRFRYYDPERGDYISQDPIRLNGGLALYEYVKDVNQQIDPLGLETATIIYNHKIKPGKTTDIKELNRQMREQIRAYNKILKNEGIDGLKQRVRNYGPELEKKGRAHTKSLGSAGPNKIWAHTPDMKTGGLPTDVSKIPAGARENSILGGGNAQRISEEILNMSDKVTKIKGKINYH